ncbi:hypothetical protein [Xanthobacter autotrophicus]|uniref:hypothetical protein n=1 Tax=Xanthobacter autotrophicus TaxID=280 RepID=UPI0024A64B35|nr:hypothetical protein [Xanthobacter autotrophicus]MDI4654983.1 hypothetical protein [Xanthobacter autotrophicus]
MTEGRQVETKDAASAAIRIGGVGVVLGAVMIAIVSGLYAASPTAATMPVVTVRLPEALEALRASDGMQLWWIGVVGLTGDVIFAAAAMMVAFGLVLRGQSIKAAGWLGIALSNIIFVSVDALVGRTFVTAASSGTSEAGFVAAKSFSDALFISGTFAFGAGALLVFGPALVRSGTSSSRAISFLGTAVGLLGAGAALICLFGADAGQLLGLAIAAGSAIFLIVGLRAATRAVV